MVCIFRYFLGPFSFKYRRQLLEQIFANFMRGNLLKDSYDSLGESMSFTLMSLRSSSFSLSLIGVVVIIIVLAVVVVGDGSGGSLFETISRFALPHSDILFLFLADLKKLLTEPAQVSTWHTQGLPRDQYSIENAVFISRHKKYPLIIDPQVD